MLRKYNISIFLFLFGLITAVSGILSNIAASTIPETWQPYLWLSWPLFGVFTFASIAFGIWQGKIGDKSAADIDLIQQQRNRKAILNQVYNTWIEGLLKKSLFNELPIELRMETQPDAVVHPWNVVVQLPGKEPELLPAGKTMLEVFREASETLLILGEPGSGKTTFLLDLTQQAVKVAETDPNCHIPVVFNLSSWTPKLTLTDWLISELRDKYSVPIKICQQWVLNDELMLLLDGLDEVKSEYREQCALAINTFTEDHQVPLAVCSRRQEYEELTTRLHLGSAVLIQPLEPEQVNWVLRGASKEIRAAYQILKHDASLQDFVQTPLALSILLLAYSDSSVEDTERLMTAIDRRKNLFDTYIKSMFKRRGINRRYPPDKITHWLSCLSKVMIDNGQLIFYIENLNLGWIQFFYSGKRHSTLIKISIGLILGLLCGLFSGLLFGWVARFYFGIDNGLVFGRGIGLIFGLVLWLMVWMHLGLEDGQTRYLLGRRFLGLLLLSPGMLRPSEKIAWSWKEFKYSSFFLLIFVLVVGLSLGFTSGQLIGHSSGLIIGLLSGVFTGLAFGILFGLTSQEVENRSQPAQGIRSSWKNACLYGLFFGLLFGLTLGLIAGLFFGLRFGFLPGLLTGLVIFLLTALILGQLVSLIYGVLFLFTHYIYRWFLFQANVIPWNLVAFLDYAAERIFLRRIGGGYIFIHRMLLEHFAEMDTALPKAK